MHVAAGLGLLLVAALASCGENDPLAERLAARAAHEAEVVSFSPRDDGTVLVELEVRSSVGPSLPVLTVAIRQHDAETEILRSERVTLDISRMDATGVVRVYATVEAAPGAEVFSSVVEHGLGREILAGFPELEGTPE